MKIEEILALAIDDSRYTPLLEMKINQINEKKKIVFMYGSPCVNELTELIKSKIDIYVKRNYWFYVGGDIGFDCMVQNYLKKKRYKNVLVFTVVNENGSVTCINLGDWKEKQLIYPGNCEKSECLEYMYMQMAEKMDACVITSYNNDLKETCVYKKIYSSISIENIHEINVSSKVVGPAVEKPCSDSVLAIKSLADKLDIEIKKSKRRNFWRRIIGGLW